MKIGIHTNNQYCVGRMFCLIKSMLLLVVMAFLSNSVKADIRYVKPIAAGLADGSSWANASSNIQAMINASASGDQVWVAGGTYIPNTLAGNGTSFSDQAFVLKANVDLYGSFAGTEILLTDRNLLLTSNATTLSGDFYGNDGPSFVNTSENAFHVVIAAGTLGTAIMDGFTIYGGNADSTSATIIVNGQAIERQLGGGIYCRNSGLVFSNIKVISCSAAASGGGLYVTQNSNVELRSATFTNNQSIGDGGAISSTNGSSIFLSHVNISGNTCYRYGGGVYAPDASCITNMVGTIIFSNSVGSSAAGGGLYVNGSTTLTNVLVSENEVYSGFGGGIFCGGNITCTNTTVTGNRVTYDGSGGGIYASGATVRVRNSILYQNTAVTSDSTVSLYNGATATYQHSLVQGSIGGWAKLGTDAGGNVDANPMFIKPTNRLTEFPTVGDYRLYATSPAVNTGSNSFFAAAQTPLLDTITTDIAGAQRIQGGTVNMGAYEESLAITGTIRLYVDSAKAASGDGSNWANAYKTLGEALLWAENNRYVREIYVRKGTYYPTNYPTGCTHCNSSKEYMFIMVPDVAIYGGFAGTETSLAQRNLALTTNASILSGDINKDDGPSFTNTAENSHCVISSLYDVGNARLDGFTITAGNNQDFTLTGDIVFQGGGIYTYNSSPVLQNLVVTLNQSESGGGMYFFRSSPTVRHAVISYNRAEEAGGGVCLSKSDASFSHTDFIGNEAYDDGYGGGLGDTGDSHPSLSYVDFINNKALKEGRGGGMFVYERPILMDHLGFYGNTADGGSGGGLSLGSRISVTITNAVFQGNEARDGGGLDDNGGTTIINALFTGNKATNPYEEEDGYGGAIYSQNSDTLINVTISGNWSDWSGGGVRLDNTIIRNSIIYGNYSADGHPNISCGTCRYENSAIGTYANGRYIGIDGGNNVEASPMFVAPLSYNLAPTTGGDYRLLTGSPVVNVGNNTVFAAGQSPDLGGITTDLAGATRIQGGTVDMGAYEGTVAPPTYTRLYVDSARASSGNGSNWATAYKTLGEAMDTARANPLVREIWVRKGTYYPTSFPKECPDCSRDDQFIFNLVPDVAIYGGFAGTETSLAQRNLAFAANASILSGDLNKDDGPNFANTTENSECVVSSLFDVGSARLDGFTITGGNNQGYSTNFNADIQAGGIHTTYSSPVLENLRVTLNRSRDGAGIFFLFGSPSISHTVISYNKANRSGGGIRLEGSNAAITHTDIIGNEADRDVGGGIFNTDNSSPSLRYVNFINNKVLRGGYGGGMYTEQKNPSLMDHVGFYGNESYGGRGGGLCVFGNIRINITNAVFQGNVSENGGGIYAGGGINLTNALFNGNMGLDLDDEDEGYSAAIEGGGIDTLTNVTITGNWAKGYGGAIGYGKGVIRNSIIYGNPAIHSGNFSNCNYRFENSLVEGSSGGYTFNMGTDGGGNIDADPKFAGPLSYNLAPITGGDYRLLTCSPAINAGSNSYFAAGQTPKLDTITKDLGLNPRFYSGGTVDMGAYEYQGTRGDNTLAIHTDVDTAAIATNGTIGLEVRAYCRLIATVQSAGAVPVSGSLAAKVWVDDTIPVHQFLPLVQRHYEITPAADAASATGKLTLYFTQAEFDAYNVAAAVSPYFGVPTGPADDLGKASLRIYKYAGESNNGTGLPASYPNPASNVIVDPADTDIVWNASYARWEISFEVTGFSGFFVGGVSSGVLPVRLIFFTAALANDDHTAALRWQVAGQQGISQYVVERSIEGRNWLATGNISASQQGDEVYTFNNPLPSSSFPQVFYYRLKMMDMAGNVTYSHIVQLASHTASSVQLYPVPAKDVVWLAGEDKWRGTEANLMDLQGKILQKIIITHWPQQIATTGLAAGIYMVRLASNQSIKMIVGK